MKRRKKAFTLTELLVVVVIIGVLSAVVLPKYSKMLNTRRTTEAEDIMSAVRQEQEYRCASDRNYTTTKTDLSSLASLPDSLSSKNYTYTLGGSGITATAKKGSYNLQMPSYTDGRICCSGDGCSNLNKDYVACNSIPVGNSGCEVDDPGVAPASAECTDGEVRGSQSCSTCGGVQTTQKCVNGVWTAHLGECSVAQSSCSCEMVSGPQPNNEIVECNNCGTKTVTYSCNTTNWTWQRNESECSKTLMDCPLPLPGCIEGRLGSFQNCSSCGGKRATKICQDGEWVPYLGECSISEDQCESATCSISDPGAECSIGQFDPNRGTWCTVNSNYQVFKEVGPAQITPVDSEPGDTLPTPGNTSSTKTVRSGARCDESCHWQNLPCPNASLHGGSGGGGGGGGGGAVEPRDRTETYLSTDASDGWTSCTVRYHDEEVSNVSCY